MSVERTLIRGGMVMPLDEREVDVGRAFEGDVLIQDGRIAEVDAAIRAEGAEVIDARGCLVMPGLVDAHRHVWQTALRGVCHDDTLKGYMRAIRFLRAKVYRPEDVFVGNWVGMLEAIDAGITTVFVNLEGWPDDWQTNLPAVIKFFRDHQCPSFLEYGEYPFVSATEIKKALRLKAKFAEMLDLMQ